MSAMPARVESMLEPLSKSASVKAIYGDPISANGKNRRTRKTLAASTVTGVRVRYRSVRRGAPDRPWVRPHSARATFLIRSPLERLPKLALRMLVPENVSVCAMMTV